MNEIAVFIKKIHTQLERRRNFRYRDYDLTSTQLDIMEYLYFHNLECHNGAGTPDFYDHPCNPNVLAGPDRAGNGTKNSLSDIAAFFGVQHTSIIHVLKILEKKGLIRRESGRQGSRSKPIFLTQKGHDLIQSHLCCPSDMDAVLFANIPPENFPVLEQSLRQMYENLLRDEQEDIR